MSLINEMLRDLDRRQALAVPGGPLPPGHVSAVAPPPHGRQWFWTLVAFLMANFVIVALVAWGAWPALCRAVPAIDVVVVALDLALWIGYWPFR